MDESGLFMSNCFQGSIWVEVTVCYNVKQITVGHAFPPPNIGVCLLLSNIRKTGQKATVGRLGR